MYEKPKMQKNDKIQKIKIHSEKTTLFYFNNYPVSSVLRITIIGSATNWMKVTNSSYLF